jgi:acyl transferase domain-containing protein
VNQTHLDIAVIGMDGKFPGAKNLSEFWDNLKNGVESVRTFTDEELLAAGVSQAELSAENYVKANPVLEDVDCFDAEFFNYSPSEAGILDPQQRLFLECSWNAFENAGYDPRTYEGLVGVFGGVGITAYLLLNLANSPAARAMDEQQIIISNDKDHLTTRVSYNLNLKGPSVNVNSACSSSLVAIHYACQSLRLGESDMALAGGCQIVLPKNVGYRYVKHSILSPDGHCRAFDANANGTLWGSGCGVVLLKRLDDAIRDNDNIRAVIKGSAVNNDGAEKIGYTAPSFSGQSIVVAQALMAAGMEASSISYIEAHGTGTPIGDPVEVAALSNVFQRFGFEGKGEGGGCAIGSVKTNIGHLGAAAGIAGFIKTVLALENKALPPSLNFESPNPQIDFESSPFFVNTRLRPWVAQHSRGRYAGVSSLAVGGTNAHVILGEAAEVAFRPSSTQRKVFLLSARSNQALERRSADLTDYLRETPNVNLDDLSLTLAKGRHHFDKRKAYSARSYQDLLRAVQQDTFLSVDDVRDQGIGSESLRQWMSGKSDQWEPAEQLEGRRLALPAYPFSRNRYWISPAKNAVGEKPGLIQTKKTDIAEMFYLPAWKMVPLPQDGARQEKKVFLIFADRFGLANQVAERLRINRNQIVFVHNEDRKIKHDESNYGIDIKDPASYAWLVEQLQAQSQLPDFLLHFWSVTPSDPQLLGLEKEKFKEFQAIGFYSALYLTQALNAAKILHPTQFILYTSEVHPVTGTENLRPEKASLLALCKVTQQEYLHLKCRAVDLAFSEPDTVERARVVGQVVADIDNNLNEMTTAFRRDRWVQYYEPLSIKNTNQDLPQVKHGGVYLIYSGLNGIGLAITKYLMAEKGAKVLLLEDEYFPKYEEWGGWLTKNDPRSAIGLKIMAAIELRKKGGVYIGPLLHNRNKMKQVIQYFEKREGKIDGVIHAASGSASGRMRSIVQADLFQCEEDMISIAYNLMVLDDILNKRDLEFRIILSSLGSVLGGPNFISYAASNSIAAAYSLRNARLEGAPNWQIQCWDSWDVEWTTEERAMMEVKQSIVDNIIPTVLTTAEGLDCFRRMLGICGIPQVIVAATDLQYRYDKWVKLVSVRADEAMEEFRHPRPELESEFVRPATELENTVASIFGKLLEIDSVGADDNFYEMGGHSLLGTRFSAELRKQIGVDLAVAVLYQHPTPAKISRYIAGNKLLEAGR